MNHFKNQVPTLLHRASEEVPGFREMHKRLEKKIVISGKSKSTLANYTRCLAHLALHFKRHPLELDIHEIEEYLLKVKFSNSTPSQSFFKHTVFGLRFLFRCEGLEARAVRMPRLQRESKLPAVLGRLEIKSLLRAPVNLRHRVLLGLLYGCGLRCQEVRSLLIRDVDFDRNAIHIRQGKGNKDRYVPLGVHLGRGLKTYLDQEQPFRWLFNGKSRYHGLSQRGIQHIMQAAVRKARIKKHVTAHTLRHTYATHLLEDGLDIVSIKELLGHSFIETTMVYLHVAKTGRRAPFSPLDNLYIPHRHTYPEGCWLAQKERFLAEEYGNG